MNGIPSIPETAPFDAPQRAWLNGYLAGLFSRGEAPEGAPSREPSKGKLLFLWGTQTGSAQSLALEFSDQARAAGFDARALGMEEHGRIDFSREPRIAVVTSTYGDGEMPDNAREFWEWLESEDAPRLERTEFAVLALGDTNYALFCEAGKNFDRRLEELGARRMRPRVDCDVDYEEPAGEWFRGLLEGCGAARPAAAAETPGEKPPTYSKKSPFPARLTANRLLNGKGSAKETRHIEVSIAGSGLTYTCGDALGIYPQNCPEFVQEILEAAGLDGEEGVEVEGQEVALRHALLTHFDLSHFHETLPEKSEANGLVASLRRLQPRLYSIASSPKAHPDSVHLTVGIVRYALNGRSRKGVCSTFLADRVGEESLPVFVHSSPAFRPPTDSETPMIMVGPGTGIAPFRGFLQEREAVGARGRHWLFFGDQKSACDFLYRDEIEGFRKRGILHRLDTAFSRDQAEKIYVQHRMLEAAEELWGWLQDGAAFYVCGDAKRMARDVDDALHAVCVQAGGLTIEAAAEYVRELRKAKRYQRDVY